MSWLYLAVRSARHGAPVLICGARRVKRERTQSRIRFLSHSRCAQSSERASAALGRYKLMQPVRASAGCQLAEEEGLGVWDAGCETSVRGKKYLKGVRAAAEHV